MESGLLGESHEATYIDLLVDNPGRIPVPGLPGLGWWSAGPPAPGAPCHPHAPPPFDSDFDYVKVYDARGTTGDVTQIDNGTTGKDKIIEYGGTGNVTQIINGNVGNDWLLQVGGEQTSAQNSYSGDGNDTVYQFGGRGESTLTAVSGTAGNQTFIQVGGHGNNTMDYLSLYLLEPDILSNMAAPGITL